jgi:hypothetical protein
MVFSNAVAFVHAINDSIPNKSAQMKREEENMYVAVLPRKVAGVLFCMVGVLTMVIGILGGSNGTGGPAISILIGSLFAGVGALAIRSSSKRPQASIAGQGTMVQANRLASIPAMPSTVPEAVITQPPSMLAESIAKLIGQAFSSSHYLELFGDQGFSDDWTVQDGLAAWYFLGTISLDVVLWGVFKSPQQRIRLRDACDAFLSKQWMMPGSVLDRFNTLTQDASEVVFHAYGNCKSGEDLDKFFFRCANKVLGAELPFDDSTTVALISKGYIPKTMDPYLSLGLCNHFTDTVVAAKKLIKETSISWPTLDRCKGEESPKVQLDSDYPTDAQVEECWKAYKSSRDFSQVLISV